MLPNFQRNRPTQRLDNSFIDLSANEPILNESQNKLLKGFLEEASINTITRYPDMDLAYTDLSKLIDLDKRNLYLSSGADYAIRHVIEALIRFGEQRPKRIIAPSPTYGMLEVNCSIFDLEWHPLEYSLLDDDVVIDHELLDVACSGDIIYIATPDNFTGSRFYLKDLLKYVERGCKVIIDITYNAFLFQELLPKLLLSEYPDFIFISSFSKAYFAPGLRIGYVFSSLDFINLLHLLRPAHEISGLACDYVSFCLNHKEKIKEIVEEMKHSRFLLSSFFRLKGFNVLHTFGNFVSVAGTCEEIQNLLLVKAKMRPFIIDRKSFVRITIPDITTTYSIIKGTVDPNLIRRESQVSESLNSSIYSTLKRIEINPTELCNRTCWFCPRSDPSKYKNRRRHFDPTLAEIISDQLNKFPWMDNKLLLSIAGFGEPLLNPKIVEIVKILKNSGTDRTVELITNGDLLNESIILDLNSAGLDFFVVNLYDNKEQQLHFDRMFIGVNTSKIIYRHNYSSTPELTLNNRAGLLESISNNIKFPLARRCNIPFYSLTIDWNGDVLLCPNDWERRASIPLNIKTHSLSDIWLSAELNDYRRRLALADRTKSPCERCDVNGLLVGNDSFKIFRDAL